MAGAGGLAATCLERSLPEHRTTAPLSDFGPLSEEERVFDVDPEVAHRVFDLRMPKQNLDGTDVASGPVDHGRLGSPQRVRAILGAKPMAVTHSSTNRAYWRVLM